MKKGFRKVTFVLTLILIMIGLMIAPIKADSGRHIVLLHGMLECSLVAGNGNQVWGTDGDRIHMDFLTQDLSLGNYPYGIIPVRVENNDIYQQYFGSMHRDLESAGFVVHPFLYDWRRSNTYNADKLGEFINNLLAQYGITKVDILAHSMGGVVALKYISMGNQTKVNTFITLGTPFLGSAQALHVFADGQAFDDFWLNGWLNGMDPNCTNTKLMARLMPSTYELLPAANWNRYVGSTWLYNEYWDWGFKTSGVSDIYSYLDSKSSSMQISKTVADLELSSSVRASFGVSSSTIAAATTTIRNYIAAARNFWNFDLLATLQSVNCFVIGSDGLSTPATSKWLAITNFDTVQMTNQNSGDDTVLKASALVNNRLGPNRTYVIPGIGHSDLFNNSACKAKVKELLATTDDFGPKQSQTGMCPATGINFLVDINHDGYADWVTLSTNGLDGVINWQLGSGAGFGPKQSQSGMWPAAGINYLVDINGDGYPDWVTKSTNSADNLIYWQLGNGAGFGPRESQTGMWPAAGNNYLVDINQNGFPDWVTKSTNGADDLIYWQLGTGTGFGPRQSQNGIWGASGINYLVDINRDGFADWVTKSTNSADEIIYWQLGTGAGFGPRQSQSGMWGASGNNYLVDINRDGLLDWVTKSNNGADTVIYWQLGTGSGFGPRQSQSGMWGAAGINYLVDINRDGNPDWVTKSNISSDAAIYWQLGTGTGFGQRQSQGGMWGASGLNYLVDINQDGYFDWVTKSTNSTDEMICWQLGLM
ncbi:MAG TPA: alpha/beta fold hydrolase [Bacillota bacterium]|nr:alpha/beta fold hydrolase [Bacillota bacterium]